VRLGDGVTRFCKAYEFPKNHPQVELPAGHGCPCPTNSDLGLPRQRGWSVMSFRTLQKYIKIGLKTVLLKLDGEMIHRYRVFAGLKCWFTGKWGFVKMGAPQNHPFYFGLLWTIQLLGYPHFWEVSAGVSKSKSIRRTWRCWWAAKWVAAIQGIPPANADVFTRQCKRLSWQILGGDTPLSEASKYIYNIYIIYIYNIADSSIPLYSHLCVRLS
jgi:hypothetical protein